ncbi:MAG: ribosome silencing factor, partial [Desulfamplus sp.]|nr:ribosome silencing factor [Desulfamplus sp.]
METEEDNSRNPLHDLIGPYVKELFQRKTDKITAIDVHNFTSYTDVIIIATGRSRRHAAAIAEHLYANMKKDGIRPLGFEGLDEGNWALLDFGDVIVHIFNQETHDFYDLEGLWRDAPRIDLSSFETSWKSGPDTLGKNDTPGNNSADIEAAAKSGPDSSTRVPHPVNALMILDGWGINPMDNFNAVSMAPSPFLDMLEKTYPCSSLLCSGDAVGLPGGVMGNSEVGHMNIGAGRIVYQELVRINRAISEGSFFSITELSSLMERVREEGSSLHLLGLVSDGGVHSHMDHLFALIDMACAAGIKELYIHAVLDGRDTPPKSGMGYVKQLQEYLEKKGQGTIASLCGRFYAMDRDTRWDRIEAAYRLYTEGAGIPGGNPAPLQIHPGQPHPNQTDAGQPHPKQTDTGQPHPKQTDTRQTDPLKVLEDAYASGETDEFVKPLFLTDKKGIMKDGDGVVIFNFRADRVREISRALTDPKEAFPWFQRDTLLDPRRFLCMTRYDESFTFP